MRIRMVSVLVFTAFMAAGCGDLFDVENPGSLTTDQLDSPDLYSVLAVTPEGEVCAAYDNLVMANALQSDDVAFIGSFTFTELHMWGYMEGFNSTQESAFNSMATSRWVAEDVVKRLTASDPNNVLLMNGVYWGAIARVGLADHFVGVPIDGGAAQTPQAILEGTLALFDQVAAGTADANLKAAALGSKARILRSLYFERGKLAADFTAAQAAAEAALAAKSDFIFSCHYASPGSENGLNTYHKNILNVVLDPRNVAIMDPVSGLADPRINVGAAEVAAPPPHTGMVHRFYKYPGLDADLPVSRWQEAQLIIAEAKLIAGDLAGAVAAINLVRAGAGLSAFASTDATAIDTQMKYERRLEFMVEGRRLQDHRYYSIVPWQWDDATRALGTNRRWPISQSEIAGNDNVSG
jgi:hypothetical protein